MRQFHTAIAGLKVKHALLVLASVAGSVGVATAVAASPRDAGPSLVIRYSDHMLAESAGVEELYSRIVSAAKHVCPDAPTRDLFALHHAEACRREAIGRAVQQINNSQLATLSASRT